MPRGIGAIALRTAMVVLDAQQDPNEELRIDVADVDGLKPSRGGVPVGSIVSRESLLELTLLASDNRAASALARSYPGGCKPSARPCRERSGRLA